MKNTCKCQYACGRKKTLSLDEVKRLVKNNRYPVGEKDKFRARCLDGRYAGIDLPPLARPGADAGALMELLAAGKKLGLGLARKELADIFLDLIGGWRQFHFHTDTRHQESGFGCGHISEAVGEPAAYGLDKTDMDFVTDFLRQAVKQGARWEVLEGEHNEAALLIIKGRDWSVGPSGRAFIYQADLDDERRRQTTRVLAPRSGVGEGELYNMLKEAADHQRGETIKRLVKHLPIYEVTFTPAGEFKILQVGGQSFFSPEKTTSFC